MEITEIIRIITYIFYSVDINSGAGFLTAASTFFISPRDISLLSKGMPVISQISLRISS